jgi:hypothetical protein
MIFKNKEKILREENWKWEAKENLEYSNSEKGETRKKVESEGHN